MARYKIKLGKELLKLKEVLKNECNQIMEPNAHTKFLAKIQRCVKVVRLKRC